MLLWALGRLPTRPSAASMDRVADLLGTHGLLGDGSITKARESTERATLRDADTLDEVCATYEHTRGKAREATDPEKIFAGLAAHHLAWVLDPTMPFDAVE